jgi:hypothetical protein
MAIWGHRDSERPAEEADEAQPPAGAEQIQSPAEPEDQAGESADGSAPAFWRAQGEEPGPLERVPDEAPPLEYGHVPAPADTTAPAGTTAPARTMGPAETTAPAGTITPAETMGPAQTAAPVYGQQAPAWDPAPGPDETLTAGEPAVADGVPIVDESPAGTGPPDAVLEEDIVVIDAETAVKDPALTETAPDTATEAAPGGLGHDPDMTGAPSQPLAAQVPAAAPVSPDGAAAPSGISAQRWSEILVTFVDDPRASVKMAAAAVDSAIDELLTSVQARQRALASSWQGSDTDTEQLRAALREYRRFAAQVQQMSPSAETANPASAAGN